MKKRRIAVCLLLSLLTAGLASCGEAAAPIPADSDPYPYAPDTEAVTEEPRIPSSLPETDLGGFVLTTYQSDFFYEKGIYRKEQDGDIVNDAVFNRNQGIMDKYNCVIEEELSTENYVMNTAKSFILAGDDTIDLIFDCGNSATGNAQFLLDYLELPYLDFEKPWWSAEFNKAITLNGHLFFTIGAHMITIKSGLMGIVVNKDVARNYDMDVQEMYDMARNGTWTIDKLGAYAKLATSDVNGDGVLDEKDQWGILGQNYSNWSLALGSGFQCLSRDADGAFVYSFGSEKNVKIMDKVLGYTLDSSICLFAQQMKTGDVWQTWSDMAKNGQFLFHVSALGNDMRNYDFDYGFLPVPKFDEQQSRYYHDGSLGNNRLMIIPKTTSDADKTAFLIEAMAYASYYELLPVYYQNYLNTKILRDEESVEMLQIVQDSIYYDCGALYNWGDMRITIENLAGAASNTLASTAAKKEKTTMKAIEKTLAVLEENG